MKDILSKLIELPTTDDNPTARHQAIEYIDNFFSQCGLFVERHEWNGYESIVATTRRTKTPKVLLAGHIDVVPGSADMFKLTEQDGKLYGRGVLDMKSAIAVFLQLVDDIKTDLDKYDLGLMITSDEEVGSQNGAKKLLQIGYRPQVCILPDGADNWALEQSAKGILWATVLAKGMPAHGSRPWDGESAIEKILSFLHDIRHELFNNESPATNTCNVSTINGGSAFNQIAEQCQANIDIRFINEQEQSRILSKLSELSHKHDVEYKLKLNDSAVNIDLTNPLVAAYIQSFQKTFGKPPKTINSNGSSDARFFAEYGIPTLVMYPTGHGHHGGCEWIETKALHQFRNLLRSYVDDTARKP